MESGGDGGDASGGDRWSGWAMQAVGTAGGHATRAVGTAGWHASRGGRCRACDASGGDRKRQAVGTADNADILAIGLVAVTPLQRYHVRSRT